MDDLEVVWNGGELIDGMERDYHDLHGDGWDIWYQPPAVTVDWNQFKQSGFHICHREERTTLRRQWRLQRLANLTIRLRTMRPIVQITREPTVPVKRRTIPGRKARRWVLKDSVA